MLITLQDVISCENPECREFAKIVSGANGARSYYCPVCCEISLARTVPSSVADSQARFEEYLRKTLVLHSGS